jgi:Ca-activated chloride channel family protein
MTLLSPLALALSAFAVPIIALYVLKLRRKQHVVSSTLLWQRALDDVQANAPWQRLRPSILLLLQLLALLALVLTLAGPAYTSSGHVAGDLILIVDRSYGMQAHDVTPSRFAVAISQAHALASGLPDGNVASVIGMAAQPKLEIAESSDSGAISHAIDKLRPDVSAPNFLGALSLAASLARNGQTTRVIVLTSRESGISTLPLPATFPVQIIRIGAQTRPTGSNQATESGALSVGLRPLHDLGITAFSAVQDGNHVRALARIGNFGGVTETSDLDLYVNGQLADVRPLSVDPGKQQTIFWNDLPANTQIVRVQLGHRDDVDLDKTAWAVIATPGQRRVLLVANPDYFAQTALSLDPSVQLSTLAPSAYHMALARGYDLVVFDGILPAVLPSTPILLLSPPSGRVQPTDGGAIALGRYLPGGAISGSTAASTGDVASILQFVDLSDVHVGRIRKSALPGWMLPIVTTSSGLPLLAAGDDRGQRIAVTTFNLAESDWPLRISFPIVMQNLLRYLAPGLGVGASQIAAGQRVQLLPPPNTREVRVTRPDGGVDVLQPPFAPFTDTAEPGVYTVKGTGGSRENVVRFAANFLPSRPAPATGKPNITLGGSSSGGSHAVRATSAPISVGWAVALAVLALLTAEWWFAFRR